LPFILLTTREGVSYCPIALLPSLYPYSFTPTPITTLNPAGSAVFDNKAHMRIFRVYNPYQGCIVWQSHRAGAENPQAHHDNEPRLLTPSFFLFLSLPLLIKDSDMVSVSDNLVHIGSRILCCKLVLFDIPLYKLFV